MEPESGYRAKKWINKILDRLKKEGVIGGFTILVSSDRVSYAIRNRNDFLKSESYFVKKPTTIDLMLMSGVKERTKATDSAAMLSLDYAELCQPGDQYKARSLAHSILEIMISNEKIYRCGVNSENLGDGQFRVLVDTGVLAHTREFTIPTTMEVMNESIHG